MFKQYYQRAAVNDRLDGLADIQIMQQIRQGPKKIEKRSRSLLKRLDQMGVKLD